VRERSEGEFERGEERRGRISQGKGKGKNRGKNKKRE